MGAVAEILAVELAGAVPGVVRGCYLDAPTPGTRAEGQALDVMGWAVGDQGPVEAVEFLDGDAVVWRVPVDVPRPDLTTAFPDLDWAGSAGFAATLTVTGTTAELSLQLRAVMADQTCVPLAVIRVRRGWRHPAPTGTALVSVVIPCYNQAHFLPDAIESVLAQTHPHHEVVVIDDGSTDNTREVAGRYPGVRCVRQRNSGLVAARNTGIRRSNGDYPVFLDADDRLLPDALEVGLQDMGAHPECAFVSGHYRHIGVDGRPLPTPELRCVAEDHYGALLRTNYIGMPATALYRREVFEHVTGFESSLRACEDYDLNLRITRRFPVHCHEHVVAEYRKHGSNMTRNLPLMLASALTVLRHQRRHVRRDDPHRAAYEVGVRFWQEYFGAPLAREVAEALPAGDWRRSVPGLLTLARYHPRGLVQALGPLGSMGHDVQHRLGEVAARLRSDDGRRDR